MIQSMRFRTVTNSENVFLYCERRSPAQNNEFPLKDLDGNIIYKDRRATIGTLEEGLEISESNITETDFDRTLITENHLINIITALEDYMYDLDDFKFSTQRTQSYKQGILEPSAIVYACRISTGIEISYIVGGNPDFPNAFSEDLKAGFYDE